MHEHRVCSEDFTLARQKTCPEKVLNRSKTIPPRNNSWNTINMPAKGETQHITPSTEHQWVALQMSKSESENLLYKQSTEFPAALMSLNTPASLLKHLTQTTSTFTNIIQAIIPSLKNPEKPTIIGQICIKRLGSCPFSFFLKGRIWTKMTKW